MVFQFQMLYARPIEQGSRSIGLSDQQMLRILQHLLVKLYSNPSSSARGSDVRPR